ncbi:hypothetical protein DFAR_1450031 [Desulfarculales bacterium]
MSHQMQKCSFRLAGGALGTLIGDALEMPVAGWSANNIQSRHGCLRSFVDGRFAAGSYTDDFQMRVAILGTLDQRGDLDQAYLAERFIANFQPWHGYGGHIAGMMQRLAAGVPRPQAGTDPYGNGGAMRVGVLGAAFDQRILERAALAQCRITHYHSQTLAGALAQAWMVGLACRWAEKGSRAVLFFGLI